MVEPWSITVDIVRIQFLDEHERWQTADCAFEGPTLRLGYHRYSALFRAHDLLEVCDNDGHVFTGQIRRNNVRPAINDVEPWMMGLQAPGSKIYLVM